MDVYQEVGVPEFGAPWPAMTMPEQGVIGQFTIFFALFLGGLKDFLFSLEEEWFGATHPGVGWELTLPAALVVFGVILLWRTVLAIKSRIRLLTETQLNVKLAQLSKNKCDIMIQLSEMEILLKDYDAPVKRLRACLQSSQEDSQELEWGPMEPLKEHHGGDARIPSATNTQSTVTEIKSEENIEIEVTVMKDASLINTTVEEVNRGLQDKNCQLEEKNAALHQKLHSTEKMYRQTLNELTKALIQGKHEEKQHIATLQEKIQTISRRASAAEHALAMEKNEAALLRQRIFQLTSKKLKIGKPGFLIKTIPKPPKTTKTNKPFLKTCKVLKAFKALMKI
ncbi:transport and Golgi organization protein 1 homolog isoform X5 [Oncorhynchus tshawytscha]|uniref:transport and Golgi organization protein 1 homolog isoform X5 n=1 Tax=Oncorhynchus tshawytscha TaxID=74940 RepID=UPI001C3CF200|nr:transport and Golgi organization protein 1 homolog isoform X5 [Oncorhynchus tshawytscha]